MAKEHTSVWRDCSVMVQTSISSEGVMEEVWNLGHLIIQTLFQNILIRDF
jgi:hypothetical protein